MHSLGNNFRFSSGYWSYLTVKIGVVIQSSTLQKAHDPFGLKSWSPDPVLLFRRHLSTALWANDNTAIAQAQQKISNFSLNEEVELRKLVNIKENFHSRTEYSDAYCTALRAYE